jgi:chromatin segregation and condensation protein Rec8/ScpA/Scc1 (kleisin family)
MICALLAVLELVRLQAIVLAQTEIFGAIRVRKHKMFDVVFAGGELSASAQTPQTIDGNEEQL